MDLLSQFLIFLGLMTFIGIVAIALLFLALFIIGGILARKERNESSTNR